MGPGGALPKSLRERETLNTCITSCVCVYVYVHIHTFPESNVIDISDITAENKRLTMSLNKHLLTR